MNLTGKIVGLQRDFKTGSPVILLQINENIDGINDFIDKVLSVTIDVLKKKRSNDANRYFHLLVDKIAEKMKESKPKVKNLMLARYGQLFDIDGQLLECYFPDVVDVSESTDNHFFPTNERNVVNGQLQRKYYFIRGSHTYNTAEMSQLIEGTVEEAKQLGIETMTPIQLQHLYDLWEKNHGQKQNRQVSQE